ncbi:hypothetical protein ACFWQ1_28310 [Streptomyces albidoflavus]|uniref:MarR family winged helix-turn-helix transcriptional regulator n=1 Tax=Streptomyces sp. CNQ431 TaxID=1571532 RepID=UPI00053D878C|nr:MarR family winged helix-turn-helix transcriptional regulator [Streptomyces sp. CNQ431]QPA01247.1 MarR family transcriptional regulator [Streptomyces violascens]
MTVIKRMGAWMVTMYWPGGTGGSVGPREVHVVPADDADPQEVARGISSTVLRRINTAPSQGFAAMRSLEEAADMDSHQLGERLAALPAGLTDERLAVLSALYVHFVDAGERAPAQRLAVAFDLNPATVKGHLRAARQRGFLTKVEGKAGGRLTDKSNAILRGMKHGAGTEEV